MRGLSREWTTRGDGNRPLGRGRYHSGGSHLMSGIIRAATGRHTDDYARKILFPPLGIRECHWPAAPSTAPC
jgi:CubicO group peptidase (beta-lactamase class C family)